MIITSAWRGVARNASEPKRAISNRAATVLIISIAQQARPKVRGHSEFERAQLRRLSNDVTRTLPPFSMSPMTGVALSWKVRVSIRLGMIGLNGVYLVL